MTNFEKVQEFHKKYKCEKFVEQDGLESTEMIAQIFQQLINIYSLTKLFQTINKDKTILRLRLIVEEIMELTEAMLLNETESIAKELADVLYVVYGTGEFYNLPMDKIYEAVHNSNMSKDIKEDAGGKILKGENYRPPNIKEILNVSKNN